MGIGKNAKVFIFNYGEAFDYSAFVPIFSKHRLSKLDECRHDQVKMQLAAAEIAVCEAMRTLEMPYAPPEYWYGYNGMPRIKSGYISISHTRGAAVCAVSADKIGVDIEASRKLTQGLAKRILCEEELKEFELFPTLKKATVDAAFLILEGENLPRAVNIENNGIADKNSLLLQTWTAKESYLKLTGEGLGGGMTKHLYDRRAHCVRSLKGGIDRPVSAFELSLSDNEDGSSGNICRTFLSVCTEYQTDVELYAVGISNGALASSLFFSSRRPCTGQNSRGCPRN